MPNRRVTRRVTRSKHASIIECHRLRRQNMTEEQKKAESAARLNRKHRQKQREREAALAQKEYAENKLKRLARKRELGRIRAARYRERLKDKKFKNSTMALETFMAHDASFMASLSTQYSERIKKLSSFVDSCHRKGFPVVLLTSGGTTVPLESRTIRFIDNFSSGRRGSASAEHFLEQGYAVIFLYRHKTLKPFDRHLANKSPLDVLELSGKGVKIKDEYEELCKVNIEKKEKALQSNMLHFCEFTSVLDYLTLLRVSSMQLRSLGSKAVLYLAAAVSDFYIPTGDLPEHKIQSSGGPINLSLQLVPKLLKPLVKDWIPDAYIISFKLETDANLLIPKAQKALETYNHKLVVGNILDTRTEVVWLVTKDATPQEVRVDSKNPVEIESLIVSKLVKLHHEYLQAKDSA